jgi:hypothetical protein
VGELNGFEKSRVRVGLESCECGGFARKADRAIYDNLNKCSVKPPGLNDLARGV